MKKIPTGEIKSVEILPNEKGEGIAVVSGGGKVSPEDIAEAIRMKVVDTAQEKRMKIGGYTKKFAKRYEGVTWN